METKTLVVNGIPRRLLVNPDDTLVDVLRGQLQLTQRQGGLRQGPVRRLYRDSGRQGGALLHHQNAPCAGKRRRHHSGGHRYAHLPASVAAFLDFPRRGPVRFLHAGFIVSAKGLLWKIPSQP